MHNSVIAAIMGLFMLHTAVVPAAKPVPKTTLLAKHNMPLDDRYAVESVNNVFKDNILLSIAYMEHKVKNPAKIDWERIRQPFRYTLVLKPKEIFAFHNNVLSEFQNKKVVSTNAHFNYQDGFESDGYLYGDGVCHLASLLYWVAKDAGLKTEAPTNHDFAHIPDIPKKYGVAIYYQPGTDSVSANQNLYIENTKKKPVTFAFNYDGKTLSVSSYEGVSTN